jgi:hypothetical protein
MKKQLKDKIFSQIEQEKIEPIPQLFFKNKYRILWLSIVLLTILAIIF